MIPLALALLGGCPEVAPERVFAREVVPVLERSCAASTCHGVTPDAEARGEVVDWSTFVFRLDGDGHVADPEAARAAALPIVNTVEAPEFSTLLRKAMDPAYGGLPHYGGTNFTGPDDPGFAAIAAWIALEPRGGEDPAPLDALERRFGDEVLPVLVGLGCASGGCHGPDVAVPFRLEPGVGGAFSAAQVRANRDAARVMLALDGDPRQSRLLRKMLPLFDGGLLHKGGNDAFLRGVDDPRLAPIHEWICAERAVHGASCPGAEVDEIVFVRGPLAPSHPFDLDVWAPGGDLWRARLDGGAAVNLTAGLHDGPVDLRDPAVSPDGERVAFAMRTSAATGHDLYELTLATGALRRLTADAGPLPGGGLATYRDPAYGPDDTLWFVSTRAGVLADDGARLDADLYELDLVDGALRRRTRTPHIEREPTHLVVGEEAGGEVAFTALRDAVRSQARGHPFRFPTGLSTEYHQHFGITPPETLTHDLRELPDGNYVVVLGDLDGVWGGGRLAVVDRNFGPEIPSDLDAAASLPFYAAPLSRLDDQATSRGVTGALYRDPAPLPDGRVLVAYAAGPLDLADPDAVVDTGIVALTLGVDRYGAVEIVAREAVVDAPGVADFDPLPIAPRTLPSPEQPWAWDEMAATGWLRHQGLPVIDALLDGLPPAGQKRLRDDLIAVRLVEALPYTPSGRAPVDPSTLRHPQAGATRTGAGPRNPARILAELPLEDDGTFHVALPAGVAFRVQGLDADGVAVGRPHNRWFDVNPGQVIPQGVQPRHYTSLCAACHGALDGDPTAVFQPPDLLTTASLSLARYDGQDPRRPRAPPVAGSDTRVEVDFVRDVQPILTARCASCHQGAAPPAGLSLTDAPTAVYTDAYESLLAPGEGSANGHAWVDGVDGGAFGSFLAEALLGRELGAPRALATPGAPHPSALPDVERRTLLRWMDLGASFVGVPEAR